MKSETRKAYSIIISYFVLDMKIQKLEF